MIIGVTGNSGSGKSLLSDILKESGALVLDCDKINHYNLLNNKDCINEVIDFFGDKILDNNRNINKKSLSRIVFNNIEKLNVLISITHKYVIDYVNKSITKNKDKYNLIVIDAPLLIESKLHEICDRIWVIDAGEDIKINRIILRDGLSLSDAKTRLLNQMKPSELKQYADQYILNNGSVEDLKLKIEKLLNASLFN